MAIRRFALVYGIVFLVVIMGLIPVLRTTFGLIPLYGHDVWLHVLLAAVAGYFGFVARADTGAATTATAQPR